MFGLTNRETHCAYVTSPGILGGCPSHLIFLQEWADDDDDDDEDDDNGNNSNNKDVHKDNHKDNH